MHQQLLNLKVNLDNVAEYCLPWTPFWLLKQPVFVYSLHNVGNKADTRGYLFCARLNEILSASCNNNRVENIWIDITKNKKKYIIGGMYRHPNQSIDLFRNNMDAVLANIAAQHLPCIIAGDINIDLTKCDTSSDTADYVDMLLANAFVPLIVMPTRITSRSATLIDH
jgi:hypothetical protein